MRERLKTILCIVLSLTAAVGLMLVRDSAAWINTHTGSPLSQSLASKQFKFEFSGAVHSALEYTDGTPFVITDRNLVRGGTGAEDSAKKTSLQGVNKSQIATQIRFKVFYTSPVNNPTGTLSEYDGSNSCIVQVDYNTTNWSFDSTNHYFYRTLNAVNLSTNPNGVAFDLLYGIQLSDDNLEAAMESAGVSTISSLNNGRVMVAIQVRQSDFMMWSDLGAFNSSTGFVATAATSVSA